MERPPSLCCCLFTIHLHAITDAPSHDINEALQKPIKVHENFTFIYRILILMSIFSNTCLL